MFLRFFKKKIKSIVFGFRSSQETYVDYLRKCGVQVGEHVEIFYPHDTVIESLNPHLLKIGNHVSMTGPVTILNHDYSVCVLKKWTGGEILGKQRATIIGNNVFLGWGCCILPGTTVGDNTIIGAYSVVSGVVEDNSVYAGNPAKKICSISDYYNKIKSRQLDDACEIYRLYVERFHKTPPREVFHEYFYLFEGSNFETLSNLLQSKFYDHGNFDETKSYFESHVPQFPSFSSFCTYAETKMAHKLNG